MAIKINVGFGERITSAGINEKIAGLAGKDFKIEGLEARFTGQNQITVSPGKCMMQGAVIESDEDIIVEIPADMQTKDTLALVGIYNHEQRSFNIKTYPECYIGDLELASIDMASRGIDNKLEKMDNASILDLLENPDKVEIRRFVSETGEEIVFDSVAGGSALMDSSGLIMDGFKSVNAASTNIEGAEFSVLVKIHAISEGDSRHLISFVANNNVRYYVQYIKGGNFIQIYSTSDYANFQGFYLTDMDIDNLYILIEFGANGLFRVTRMDTMESRESANPVPTSNIKLDFHSELNTKNWWLAYNRLLSIQEVQSNLVFMKKNPNYLQHRVDTASAVIEGTTVKNMCEGYNQDFPTSGSITGWSVKDKQFLCTFGTWGYSYGSFMNGRKPITSEPIKKGVKYYISWDYQVTSNPGGFLNDHYDNLDIYIGFADENGRVVMGDKNTVRCKLNDRHIEFIQYHDVQKPERFSFYIGAYPTNSVTATNASMNFKFCISETPHIEYPGFGLNSVSAVIANNDTEHPIYNPVITGSTKIMKDGVECAAGTAGAVLVSKEPTDKSLPALGGIPLASDNINLNSNTITLNTVQGRITGDLMSVGSFNLNANGIASMYTTKMPNFYIPKSGEEFRCLICPIFKRHGQSTPTANEEGIFTPTSNGIYIRLFANKLATQDAAGFMKWLDENEVIVRYKALNPQIIQLTDEQLKAYDAHREPIELGSVGDVKDTLEILEDGSALWTQRTTKKILDGTQSPMSVSSQNSTLIGIGDLLPYGTFQRDHYKLLIESDKELCVPGAQCTTHAWSIRDDSVTSSFPGRSYMAVWDNGHLMGVFEKGVYGQDRAAVIEHLKRNPITIIGLLPTPITTKIPAHLVPKFLQQKHLEITTNRISLKSAVAGKFEVTAPTIPADNHRDLREMMLAQKAEHEAGKTSVITSDGEEIIINQGSEVGSAAIAKITGQTAKNLIVGYSSNFDPTGSPMGWSIEKHAFRSDFGNHGYAYSCRANHRGDFIHEKIEPSTQYYISWEYDIVSNPNNLSLEEIALIPMVFSYPAESGEPVRNSPNAVGATLGLGNIVYTSHPGLTANQYGIGFRTGSGITLEPNPSRWGRLVLDLRICVTKVLSRKYFKGLHGSQATLTVNSEQGSVTTNIYEPTIKGLTKIVDANGNECAPGTTGAKLVSLESYDPALPPLCSVGDVYDEIDIASKTLIKRIYHFEINGSEPWVRSSAQENLLAKLWRANLPVLDATYSDKSISDKLVCASTHIGHLQYYIRDGEFRVGVNKSDCISPDMLGFKDWLSKNKPQIKAILKTPEIIALTDKQLQSYLHHRKVIELNKVGDVADEIIVNADGSGEWVNKFKKVLFNGTETWYKENYYYYTINVNSMGIETNRNTRFLSDKIINNLEDDFTSKVFAARFGASNVNLLFNMGDTIATVQDHVNWLSTNKPLFLFKLSQPITTHIPKELMPQIPLVLNPGRNEVVAGGAVKPSLLELKRVHGDKALKNGEDARKVCSEIEAKTNGLARIVGGKIEGRTVKNYAAKKPRTLSLPGYGIGNFGWGYQGTGCSGLSFIDNGIRVWGGANNGCAVNLNILEMSSYSAMVMGNWYRLQVRFRTYNFLGDINTVELSWIYSLNGPDKIIRSAYARRTPDGSFMVDEKIQLENLDRLRLGFPYAKSSNNEVIDIYDLVITDLEDNACEMDIPEGLNASKAIIENGDFEARVKDPKTGEVIELNAVGDYKDSIEFNEDGSAVWTRAVQVFNSNSDSDKYILSATQFANVTRSSMRCNGTMPFGPSTYPAAICDRLNRKESWELDSPHFYISQDSQLVSMNFNVYTPNGEFGSMTPQEYLKSKPYTMIYLLNEPVITHIPPEFTEYLPIHRGKNELTAGGAVKADITENLQLEFNDNIYDKAAVPTIKDGKITGMYLPELRKHFKLGSTNGYSIDEIEQRIHALENPVTISEYSSDLSGTVCGVSNGRAEFLIDTKSPMRVGCPTSTHKATVLSVIMSDGSQKLMDISNSLLRLESTDSQRFKVSIQENIAGAVGAVIVSGQIQLDAKSY